MITLPDSREELRQVRDKIRVIRTDQWRDPVRIARHFHETVAKLRRQIEKLHYDFEHRDDLIAEYESLIAKYEREIRLIKEGGERIKRLLRLVKTINKLDKTRKITTRRNFGEGFFTAERLVDLRTFIRGYEHEIEYLRGLDHTLPKRVEELSKALAATHRHWDDFVEHRIFGAEMLDELLAREKLLGAIVVNMVEERGVQRYQVLKQQINDLEAEIAAEMTKEDEEDALLDGDVEVTPYDPERDEPAELPDTEPESTEPEVTDEEEPSDE